MKRLRNIILSHQMAGWADQLVVSGASFVILLAVARWATVEDVGYYALGFSILAMAVTVQDSLVTRPFTIQMFSHDGPARTHAAGSLALAFLLAAGLAIIAALGAAGLAAAGAASTTLWITLGLAAAIPPALLREFARRFAFAHMAPGQALAADAAATLLGLAGIAVLGLGGYLSALTALLALAAGSGLAFTGWIVWQRSSFVFEREAFVETVRRSIGLGKWLLTGQLALRAQGYAAHWITLVIGGAAVTGLYSACLSIVALTNPFLFGYFNILTPKYVRVLKDSGLAALRREAAHGALFLGMVTGGFALGIALFGPWILGVMFPGEGYRAGGDILTLLAVASAAGSVGGPAGVALMALEKGRPLAVLSTAVCILGSALVLLLMWGGGLAAAAIGILLTEVLGSIARWIMLFRLTPEEAFETAGHAPAPALT